LPKYVRITLNKVVFDVIEVIMAHFVLFFFGSSNAVP